jgi:hypothetical protein
MTAMDLSPTEQQRDITKAVRAITERGRAGSGPTATLDRNVLAALDDAGFLDVATAGGDALDATFVVDEAAAAGVCAPIAARAIVAPAVLDPAAFDGVLPTVIGLVRPGALVRFGADAELFLVADGDRARSVPAAAATVTPQRMRWGYPVARVDATGGTDLGQGSGEVLLRAWRTALAAEAGGLMRAAVLQAAKYVRERVQFGRPIGVYQSVQHRLARGWVLAEGATWLARQAAASPDDDVRAAAAACYACEGMREVFRSVHQVVGAMGITDEFGLTRLTGKLAYLHLELGGAASHARALADRRWFTPVTAA